MQIGKVIGTLVATKKHHKMDGAKLLLVQPLTLEGKPRGVAVLASVTQSGGFPPLLMDPVDLSAIYRQNLAAIQAQNAQVAAGRIGAQPNPITQQISATVLVKGQLASPEEFGAFIKKELATWSVVIKEVGITVD